MKAKELINRLQNLVKENGDLDILVADPESIDFDTIKNVQVVMPDKYNGIKSPGIELEVGLL